MPGFNTKEFECSPHVCKSPLSALVSSCSPKAWRPGESTANLYVGGIMCDGNCLSIDLFLVFMCVFNLCKGKYMDANAENRKTLEISQKGLG